MTYCESNVIPKCSFTFCCALFVLFAPFSMLYLVLLYCFESTTEYLGMAKLLGRHNKNVCALFNGTVLFKELATKKRKIRSFYCKTEIYTQ